MKTKYIIRAHNLLLMFLVILINLVGILVLYSASDKNMDTVMRQLIGSLIGIVCALIVSVFDYERVLRLARPLYIGTIVMLVLVLLIGVVRQGAGRWIILPFIGQIQPAEFAKLSLILFFADFFEKHRNDLMSPKTLASMALLIGLPVILIFIEPNLSTAVIVTVIFIVTLFASGLDLRLILIFTLLGALLFWLVMFLFTTDNYNIIPFIKDYQKERILGFLFPDQYSDTYFQQANSITAIGSGGFFGKGLGNTGIDSVKSGNFLIEEDTDFIFAIIGEELGFRGCLLILIIYTLLIILILWIGMRSQNIAAASACIGIASWIGFQTFTNIAVATAIFPNTGVTLPFISRGVSSLLALYISVGVVMNIGYQSRE